ncbi:MAG: energy transducer TonB [Cytophagales bacterium]|nr:energy transducer TonB [Cytophagales bacterium]
MEKRQNLIKSTEIEALITAKSDRVDRRERSKHAITWFSFCMSILSIILVFEWKTFEQGGMVQLTSFDPEFEDLLDIPVTQQPPPPPPAVQQPVVIEVPDDEEIEEEIEFDLDINMNEDDVIEEIVAFEAPEEEVAETIFQVVEEMPSPRGGMRAFYKYLNENLKYPQKAARIGMQGRVFLSFVVETDGSLTDIKVLRGIGAGCDEESIRVMQNAPKWNPGKQRGNPVRVRYFFPIVFRLN